MKGVYELRPPLPRYTHTWDAAVLLEHIRKQPTNPCLSLKQLTMKLCALLHCNSTKSTYSSINTIELY